MTDSTSRKKIVLVVEDDRPLRRVLKLKLENEGFKVYEAKDGEQGLAYAFSKKPDIILLDLLMPVKDGKDMLKELRKDEWGKNVNVVILTNLSNTEDVAEAMTDGVYEYFVKAETPLDSIVKVVQDRLSLADE